MTTKAILSNAEVDGLGFHQPHLHLLSASPLPSHTTEHTAGGRREESDPSCPPRRKESYFLSVGAIVGTFFAEIFGVSNSVAKVLAGALAGGLLYLLVDATNPRWTEQ
ncbi:MAG: hypothetical protein HYR64_08260 [Fimbriimonas ginsengisoli]|uniref:Uncharacterized protein n=1 Tax=Fimbriimonas ginsengisoli TaxID=1005039 RepID=A0A931PWW3_FIMGI|nr:hypothetical protein [Fimbriimonas ginsengisoli]